MRCAVLDFRVRADFAEASIGRERSDVRNEPGSNSSPPEFRPYPNAFEKRNRSRRAAVRVFADREFCETDRCAVDGLRDKAPGIIEPNYFVDARRMLLRGFLRPQRATHFGPGRSVGRSHFSDGNIHAARIATPFLRRST
jgi:hypothetical protein